MLVVVQEDPRNDRRVGEKRQDLHLSTAAWAEQRQHSVDTSEEHGPAAARGIGGSGELAVAHFLPNRDRAAAGSTSELFASGRPIATTMVAMSVHTRRWDEASEPLQ